LKIAIIGNAGIMVQNIAGNMAKKADPKTETKAKRGLSIVNSCLLIGKGLTYIISLTLLVYWGMNKVIGDWVVRLHRKKAKYLVDLVEPFLTKKAKIMDLGCGSGEVSQKLLSLGYLVTSVDVVNKVKVEGVKVLVYDGEKLPFGDKEFEKVLLITVLHHVDKYEELLREVARVSKELIIVEDVYENNWDKFNIWFWDSVLNLEFFGHPHHNQSDIEWKKTFEKLGFVLKKESEGRIREIVYEFKQKAYWLLV